MKSGWIFNLGRKGIGHSVEWSRGDSAAVFDANAAGPSSPLQASWLVDSRAPSVALARGYVRSVVLTLILGTGVAIAADTIELSGRAMGTTWLAKFVQTSAPLDRDEVSRRIAARLEQIEEQFSNYRPDSEISRFNSGGNDWIPVSREIAIIALEAREVSGLTDGAFDVTVDPLVRLWGFGPEGRTAQMPVESEISAVRLRVGWRNLEARIESPALRRTRPGITVDFSSIAKGFASDALGDLLAGLGAASHFVQVGGDLKTSGHNADGGRWRAGIETPNPDKRVMAYVVKLSGHALSTSGDYRNFVMHEGRRYSHIIDPRTGLPAATGLAAVSVVHTSCARSSALATALFVLGPAQGFKLALEHKLACVFFVRRGDDFDRRTTPQFDALAR